MIFKRLISISKWGLVEWIGYFLAVVGLVVGGMQLDGTTKYNWASKPVIIIGFILFLIAILYLVFRNVTKTLIFPIHGDGKKFILEKIRRACTCNSSIFSTFLLERAKDDLITNLLINEIDIANSNAIVSYERFIMIDDPTQEKKWITDFLSISSYKEQNSLLKINPIIYAVESPGRPIVRLIQAMIPRIGITLIKTSIDRKALVYISLSDTVDFDGTENDSKFGIALNSNKVHTLIESFLKSNFLRHPDKIRTFKMTNEYEQKTIPSSIYPLTNRILNEIEEIALTNLNIKHIGIFGSYAKQKEDHIKAIGEKKPKPWKADSDLDLLIIIEENSNREEVKQLIETRLRSQVDKSFINNFEIEWSNEHSNFYYFRKKYHIDIQLHVMNDDYYINETPLLGYSIFSQNYFELYSKNSLPVSRFILIEQTPLSFNERESIFLHDPLGLIQFIKECSKNDPNIDPRRVFAVNICNLAWTVSGMRPQSYTQALTFILKKIDLHAKVKEKINHLSLTMCSIEIPPNTDLQRKYLTETVEVLKLIRDYFKALNQKNAS